MKKLRSWKKMSVVKVEPPDDPSNLSDEDFRRFFQQELGEPLIESSVQEKLDRNLRIPELMALNVIEFGKAFYPGSALEVTNDWINTLPTARPFVERAQYVRIGTSSVYTFKNLRRRDIPASLNAIPDNGVVQEMLVRFDAERVQEWLKEDRSPASFELGRFIVPSDRFEVVNVLATPAMMEKLYSFGVNADVQYDYDDERVTLEVAFSNRAPEWVREWALMHRFDHWHIHLI